MKYLLLGIKKVILDKQEYYTNELKPHEDYEYTIERYNQIEGIIEGMKYTLEIINEVLEELDGK